MASNIKLLFVVFLTVVAVGNTSRLLKPFWPTNNATKSQSQLHSHSQPWVNFLDDNVDDYSFDTDGYSQSEERIAVEGTEINIDTNQSLSPSAAPPSDQQRPWMVVHVGPPKTGTTAIQAGLNQESATLAGADNIFYVGSTYPQDSVQYVRYDDRVRGIYNSNKNKTEGVLSIHPAMGLFMDDTPETFVRVMKYHQQQKHNVVISAEHYTNTLPRTSTHRERTVSYFERIYDRVFLREGGLAENLTALSPIEQEGIEQKKRLRRRRRLNESKTVASAADATQQKKRRRSASADADESSRFGFDVKIVVTYRHYFQWLPSYYYQDQLLDYQEGAPTLIDYIENALGTLGDEYFVDGESAKNTVWSMTTPPWLINFHGTLFPYLKWSSQRSLRNSVEIFDMHQQQIVVSNNKNETLEDEKSPDLFRDFICQSLPTALETCSSLQRTKGKKPLVANDRIKSGPVSSLETGKLSDTLVRQMIHAANDRFPEHQKSATKRKEGAPIITYYDVDIARSIFNDQTFERLADNFYEWALRRKEKSSDDGHRQLCLGKDSALALKTASWNMLRHLEALVRMRDDDRIREADEQKQQQQLFGALAISRPKYPLLLSPNKYNHGGLPNARNSENENKNDEDWWAPIKRAHDELFQQTVERGAYCELDLDRLFADHDFVKQVFYKP
jgi:hypothetical protein